MDIDGNLVQILHGASILPNLAQAFAANLANNFAKVCNVCEKQKGPEPCASYTMSCKNKRAQTTIPTMVLVKKICQCKITSKTKQNKTLQMLLKSKQPNILKIFF